MQSMLVFTNLFESVLFHHNTSYIKQYSILPIFSNDEITPILTDISDIGPPALYLL